MTKRPHWTDKYITKQSLGAISRVPGNEVVGGEEEPVARPAFVIWIREHALLSYAFVVIVLPVIGYTIAFAAGLAPPIRLAATFVPSILIAAWYVTRR